jgi:integrase
LREVRFLQGAEPVPVLSSVAGTDTTWPSGPWSTRAAVPPPSPSSIRLGELRGLTVDDLRVEGRKHYLKVWGKGAKERLVPISRRCTRDWRGTSPGLGANPIRLARVVGHTSLAMINSVYQHLSLDDAHNDLMRALLAADEKR